jgi:MATE family multidrug resistance protein
VGESLEGGVALGAFGAAIATTLVGAGSLTICWLAVRAVLLAGAGRARPSRGTTRAIVRLGAPVGLQLGAEVGIFALTGFLAGTLGRLPSAGH